MNLILRIHEYEWVSGECVDSVIEMNAKEIIGRKEMMPDQKPREFWIAANKTSIGHSYMGWIWYEENPNADHHVIEYSAYEKLQKQFDDYRVKRASCCVDNEQNLATAVSALEEVLADAEYPECEDVRLKYDVIQLYKTTQKSCWDALAKIKGSE